MNKRSEQLKNFLRGKKLLTRFKLNAKNTFKEGFVFGERSPNIGMAFIWSSTPEGSEFWRDLDIEFKEYITAEDVKRNQHYLA